MGILADLPMWVWYVGAFVITYGVGIFLRDLTFTIVDTILDKSYNKSPWDKFIVNCVRVLALTIMALLIVIMLGIIYTLVGAI